jgi:hypothetical protein
VFVVFVGSGLDFLEYIARGVDSDLWPAIRVRGGERGRGDVMRGEFGQGYWMRYDLMVRCDTE